MVLGELALQGAKGDLGPQGAIGTQGTDGAKGSEGDKGATGTGQLELAIITKLHIKLKKYLTNIQ